MRRKITLANGSVVSPLIQYRRSGECFRWNRFRKIEEKKKKHEHRFKERTESDNHKMTNVCAAKLRKQRLFFLSFFPSSFSQ